MATIASSSASAISMSPSFRLTGPLWAWTTVCATSPGVIVSPTAVTVAHDVHGRSSQPDDAGAAAEAEGRPSVSDSTTAAAAAGPPGEASAAPERAGLVLVTLIIVAGVANLNLSVANVALPDIGTHFDSSQTTLDLIAVGYSLGLACSVLWLGALGDRYGRKLMLLLGTTLAVPMSLLAAYAPSDTVLFA